MSAAGPFEFGGFAFASDGTTTRIQGHGREASLPTFWFLRSVKRILWFDFLIGQFEFYGGFGVTNDGGNVYLLMLGDPKIAVKVSRDDARAFFQKLYDAFRPEGYRELT